LKAKEREKQQATHIEDTQRLATEIEILKVVLHLVSRKKITTQSIKDYSKFLINNVVAEKSFNLLNHNYMLGFLTM